MDGWVGGLGGLRDRWMDVFWVGGWMDGSMDGRTDNSWTDRQKKRLINSLTDQ